MVMNINAAEKLLSKYKEITLEQLEERFESLSTKLCRECDGEDIMESFTGFGSCSTCILCLEAKKLSHSNSNRCEDFCECCVYKRDNAVYPYCIDGLYNKISCSSNAKELYEVLQERINYLEQTIKLYYETRRKRFIIQRFVFKIATWG